MYKNFTALICGKLLCYTPKFFIVMKLSILFLMFAFMQVSAASFAQKVSIKMKNASIDEIFYNLTKQTGQTFIADASLTKKLKPINLNMSNVSLNEVLLRCFEGQKIKIILNEADKIVVIRAEYERSEPPKAALTITGKITNEKALPIAGVSIRAKNAQAAALSRTDGSYSITVSDPIAILVFSFVGYTTQEVPIGKKTVIDIVLKEQSSGLDEVVVVGYGAVKRGDITGSVSSIKGSEIANVPVVNLSEALQGRVAGLDATAIGYSPGDDMQVRIRGNRSIKASNAPLLIVDGIPMQSINDINTSDVQSVDVLKDASASAIYGSRAANGVIIVTTKRGKSGKTSISYTTYYGIQTPTRLLDLMDGAQYAELRREAFRNPSQSAPKYTSTSPDYTLDNYFFGNAMGYGQTVWESVAQGWSNVDGQWVYNPDQVRSFDWQKFVMRTGKISNHQLNINGGNEKSTLSFTLSRNTNDGIVLGQDFQRYSMRFNLDHTISKRFKVGTSSFYSNATQNLGAGGLYKLATLMVPLAQPFDADGVPVYQPMKGDVRISTRINPYYSFSNIDENKVNRFALNFYGEASILPGLKYRLNLADNPSWMRRGNYLSGQSNERVTSGTSRVSLSNTRNSSLLMENILNYNKAIDKNNDISFTALYSIQADRTEGQSTVANTLPYDSQIFYNLGTASNIESISSSLIKSQLASYMARVNYAFKDKYLLTVTGRWDGASVLAEGNKWQFFPSAALAWRMEKEQFIKKLTYISQLKLRLGYGVTGNSSIDPYETQGSLDRTPYILTSSSGETAVYGFEPNVMPNKNLKWETTSQLNLGLDFGFLKNRINGSIDIYNQSTRRLLMDRQIPATNGFTSVIDNIGETRNRGIELTMQTINIAGKGFTWSSNFIYSRNKEEIVKLYNTTGDDIGNGWFIGQPIKTFYDYKVLDIWGNPSIPQSEWDRMKADPFTKPGLARTLDVNNNGLRDTGDRVILGSEVPTWTGSISNNFSYKGFDFSFLLYAKIGQTIASNVYDINQRISLNSRENSLNLNYWSAVNPTGTFPQPYEIQANPKPETAFRYFKGSFVRLRTITLGYSFPKRLISKAYLSSLKIYATAQNPLLFTKYPGLDPEGLISSDAINASTGVRNASSNYNPSPRTFILGLNVNF